MTGKKCKTTLRALVVVRIIRASPSGRSRIKWWLPSGSHVLPGIQSDTSEYALIFPVPNETHCYDPSWQLLTHGPQASGYIKKDNLNHPRSGKVKVLGCGLRTHSFLLSLQYCIQIPPHRTTCHLSLLSDRIVNQRNFIKKSLNNTAPIVQHILLVQHIC